jgi:hypothetical protein
MKNLVPLICTVLFAACGISEAEVDVVASPESDVVTEELGTVVNSYVTLRRDMRRCMAPLCGGYWVHDLNRTNLNEKYVSGLDFSRSGMDDTAQAQVFGGGDEVVLRGRLGPAESQFKTRPFIVLEAWRGMPGVVAAAGETIYRVTALDIQCFAAPCSIASLKKVNYALTRNVDGLSVERAALSPLVDQAWMTARVLRHDALIAAKIIDGQQMAGGKEKLADASQVFIRIPNSNGPCPMMRLAMCPQGQVHTYSRSDEMCMLPAGCVTPGVCAQFIPSCPDGYSLATWSGGQFACPAHACDPSFLNPEN